MKLINKYASFILIFVLFNTSIFLIASNEEDIEGLKNICLWKYDVNGAMKWPFKGDDLSEIYKYPWDYLKKRLKMEGYKTDDASMKEYFSYVIGRSKKIWNSAIDKLLGCGSFGGHKNTFNKNLNKVKRSFVYAWDLDSLGQRDVQGNIILSESSLFKMIMYIADKLSKTEAGKKPNFDDFGEKMKEEITTTAHELMHALAELEAYSSEDNEKYECIIYCFELICFNFSNFPSYCREDKNCKVLAQPCKDHIKCKQNPPQGGSGGGSGTPKPYKPDAADDHYSYSDSIRFSDDEMNLNSEDNFPVDTFNDMLCFSYYPAILIYNKYGDSLVENLLNRVMRGNYIDDYNHDYFSNNHKILFIGSGELIGDEKSALIKQALESFVANGLCAIRTATALDFEVNKNTLSCLNRS
jgi:hypothetical protein